MFTPLSSRLGCWLRSLRPLLLAIIVLATSASQIPPNLSTIGVGTRAGGKEPAARTAHRFGPAASPEAIIASSADVTSTVYVPAIFVDYPVPNLFGAQMGALGGTSLTQLAATQSGWVRAAGVPWSAVEAAIPGVYDWTALAGNEIEWQNASASHWQPIVIVSNTPAWAQAVPGSFCGPMTHAALPAFGDFMHALVARYSVAPYNVKYWEIWNEPDVDPGLVPPNSSFGCWGDQNDDYYGGAYYADMLKVVYPQIKSADSNAQVMVGGLLLNCDPNNPQACPDPKPARFFEGILRNGGGPFFDGLAFHGYDSYGGSLGQFNLLNWNTAWNSTTRPYLAMMAKAAFLRGVMTAYNVTGKFLMNDESAVGWGVQDADPTFEATKTYYVPQVYAAALAEGLRANIWYSLDDDWHHQALLNADGSPRPAFAAYLFASQQLGSARYVGPLTAFADVRGYEFTRGNRRVWLLWSRDGASHPLPLPDVPVAAYHLDGTPLAVTSTTVPVELEPVYLEWNR